MKHGALPQLSRNGRNSFRTNFRPVDLPERTVFAQIRPAKPGRSGRRYDPPMDKTLPTVTWHPGERALQDLVGAGEVFAGLEPRIFHTSLTPQQREFFTQLRFLVVGTVDTDERVWATVVSGPPGFANTVDPTRFSVTGQPALDDPAAIGWRQGGSVAFLGIDFAMRRRFRVNGIIDTIEGNRADVLPRQVFGNCPKYIHPRSVSKEKQDVVPAPAFVRASLDVRSREIIGGADTFFVASYVDRADGERQVDVSHRGGQPGFVSLADDGWLVVGDYPGNRFFNTMGNMLLNPRAGMLFIDFATGDVLQIAGKTEVVVGEADETETGEPDRAWRVFPDIVVLRANALPLRWTDG